MVLECITMHRPLYDPLIYMQNINNDIGVVTSSHLSVSFSLPNVCPYVYLAGVGGAFCG